MLKGLIERKATPRPRRRLIDDQSGIPQQDLNAASAANDATDRLPSDDGGEGGVGGPGGQGSGVGTGSKTSTRSQVTKTKSPGSTGGHLSSTPTSFTQTTPVTSSVSTPGSTHPPNQPPAFTDPHTKGLPPKTNRPFHPNPTGLGSFKPSGQTSVSNQTDSSDGGLSTGALAAAIAVPIGVVLIAAVAFFILWRKRRSRSKPTPSGGLTEKQKGSHPMHPPPGIGQAGFPPTTPNPAVRPLASSKGSSGRRNTQRLMARSDTSGTARASRRGGPFEEPPQGDAERIRDDDAVSEISAVDDTRLETDQMSAVSDLSYQDEELGRTRRSRPA